MRRQSGAGYHSAAIYILSRNPKTEFVQRPAYNVCGHSIVKSRWSVGSFCGVLAMILIKFNLVCRTKWLCLCFFCVIVADKKSIRVFISLHYIVLMSGCWKVFPFRQIGNLTEKEWDILYMYIYIRIIHIFTILMEFHPYGISCLCSGVTIKQVDMYIRNICR